MALAHRRSNPAPTRHHLVILFSCAVAACSGDDAGAGGPDAAPDPIDEDVALVQQVVEEYFVARDQHWLGSPQAALSSGRLPHGEVAQAAADDAAAILEIAWAAGEGGLVATEVATRIGDESSVAVDGMTATARVKVGTDLAWTSVELGSSSFSDDYLVQLEREGDSWRILDVGYAPIPDTDDEGGLWWPGATADDREPPPASPRERLLATRTYDRQSAAEYALRWSRSSILYNGDLIVADQYNPEYDSARQDNDCTNFASQVLRAGGWPIHDGFASDNPVNWSPDLWGPRGPSKTWSVASWLYDYAGDPKRGEKRAVWPSESYDIWELRPGDLIFADWDPDGHFDGHLDHTMVVSGSFTELGFTEPTYSQHTPHRRNLPLSIGIKIATAPKPPVDPGNGMGGQGRVPRYYPVHIKDTFETD